jgi:hypothetical protein
MRGVICFGDVLIMFWLDICFLMGYFSDLFLKVFAILYRGGVCMISECRISDYCLEIPIAEQSIVRTKKRESQKTKQIGINFTIFSPSSLFKNIILIIVARMTKRSRQNAQ